MRYNSFKEWAIAQHANTNHMYDGKIGDPTALPYSYHLQLVNDVLHRFKWLIDKLHAEGLCPRFEIIETAAWGHDLIEDARASYNDIVKVCTNWFGFSKEDAIAIAEIIRAVTNNGRGRDRKEKMPDYIYKEIYDTPGADICKLGDRGGNILHGLLKGSSQKDMYKKEHTHFKQMLYKEHLAPFWEWIQKLLNTEL
jgi:hypothetical protein